MNHIHNLIQKRNIKEDYLIRVVNRIRRYKMKEQLEKNNKNDNQEFKEYSKMK